MGGHVVVLDVGKTVTKVSLWAPDGSLVARRTRLNERVEGPGYVALDASGIDAWLGGALAELAALAPVSAIIPVAHGAALAVVREQRLALPPMDYESPIPAAELARYAAQRAPFALTGSPALPAGLNLGAQLHWLETLHPEALAPGASLLPWPQYWAWRLCGVPASEVTSLGCHSDLWCPAVARPSPLAEHRGWAGLLPPLHRAGDRLGCLSPEWVERTGLPETVGVHCGLHDSNAALLAARAFPEIGGREATVLSTGTWFIAMRSAAEPVDVSRLPEHRDCLVNVDAAGQPVPSARFMGGREIELLTGTAAARIDIPADQAALLAAVPAALVPGQLPLPTFAAGCGPFGQAAGQWTSPPVDEGARRAAIALYAALVADVALSLIGTRERLLVEGRFAGAEVFVRALATLRPDMQVYVASAENDVSFGALTLLQPAALPTTALRRVEPFAADLVPSLNECRAAWLATAMSMETSA